MEGPVRTDLGGGDWERFCSQALDLKHAGEYQKVPARFGGDRGIDGFVRDECIYQCFSDDAGDSATDRRDAQIRKLNADIPKLKKYQTEIGQLGIGIVRKYYLLVPDLQDRSVRERAEVLTQRARGWRLPFLHPDFEILVKDSDFLATEFQQLVNAVRQPLALPSPEVSAEAAEAWKEQESDLISTLIAKLEVIFSAADDVDEWSRRLVRYKLAEDRVLEQVRANGLIWQRLLQLKNEEEGTLTVRALASSPRDDMLSLGMSYEARVGAEIGSLPREHAHHYAWGGVSDWLMRCPLSYESRSS